MLNESQDNSGALSDKVSMQKKVRQEYMTSDTFKKGQRPTHQ